MCTDGGYTGAAAGNAEVDPRRLIPGAADDGDDVDGRRRGGAGLDTTTGNFFFPLRFALMTVY